MKRKKLLATTTVAASVLLLSGFVGTSASAEVVTRYYSPSTGQHFWFTDGQASPVNGATLNYEGLAWTAPATGASVYELYNPNTWDTLLTTSSYEASQVANAGWQAVDSGGPLAGIFHSGGSVNIYRLYNPNAGQHFYTASAYEANSLVSAGWNLESSNTLYAAGGV